MVDFVLQNDLEATLQVTDHDRVRVLRNWSGVTVRPEDSYFVVLDIVNYRGQALLLYPALITTLQTRWSPGTLHEVLVQTADIQALDLLEQLFGQRDETLRALIATAVAQERVDTLAAILQRGYDAYLADADLTNATPTVTEFYAAHGLLD